MIDFEWIEKDGFFISKKPVTYNQYCKFLTENNKVISDWMKNNENVEEAVVVYIDDAIEFCEWVGYKLPTSNEWKSSYAEMDFDWSVAEWIDDMIFGLGWVDVNEPSYVAYNVKDAIYHLDFISFRCVKGKVK